MKGIPVQAYLDIWFAMFALVAFFGVRRLTLSIEETRLSYFNSKCNLGLVEKTNADLEHSSLRAGAGFIMALSWILAVPLAFSTIEAANAHVLLWSHVVGTAILIAGMAIDNVFMFPDEIVQADSRSRLCLCYSNREGCGGGFVFNSHALWHVVSVFATLATTVLIVRVCIDRAPEEYSMDVDKNNAHINNRL